MTANLASESNALKINQRFAELEAEIRLLRDEIKIMQNSQSNMASMISRQTEMIVQAWTKQYGNGPTETG